MQMGDLTSMLNRGSSSTIVAYPPTDELLNSASLWALSKYVASLAVNPQSSAEDQNTTVNR